MVRLCAGETKTELPENGDSTVNKCPSTAEFIARGDGLTFSLSLSLNFAHVKNEHTPSCMPIKFYLYITYRLTAYYYNTRDIIGTEYYIVHIIRRRRLAKRHLLYVGRLTVYI